MPNCTPNTVLITRATTPSNCAPGCGPSGAGGCNAPNLTPRKNRGAVIEELKDYVQLMLGAPVIGIEMDSQQLDLCVNQALKWVEYFAPREFFTYYTFITTPGQSVYEMPPDVGYVRHVAYRETAEFAFQSADLQGAIPIEYFYPGGAYASIQGGLIDPIQPIWGRAGEWTLYKQYERMYTRLSSSLGGWEWVNDYRHIKLYPIPFRAYRVVVHYMQKCKDWNETTLSMQELALAHAKMILGRILRKYKNPPGPGGGVQLDGAELYQEGKEEFEQCKKNLLDMWGDIPPIQLG